MQNLEKLIVSLGGTKVNKLKNTMTPSCLYRFENGIYLTIYYDPRDQYKSIELGRLFLIKDVFPRLIVLEDFELLVKAAKSINLNVNYTVNYSMLSYEQMVENVISNLEVVLKNNKQLFEIARLDFKAKEQKLEKYLIKDVSLLSIEEIEKESSKIIYKPKADTICSGLTHYEKDLKAESDNLRLKYRIPDNMYTEFEYNKLKRKNDNFCCRLTSFIILEIIALFIFVLGLINNHLFTDNNVIYFIFIVITIATVGLYSIASLSIKRIDYFIGPIFCYFIPFIFMDKIVKTGNSLLLALITIIVGTLFFAYGLIFEVIIPLKKQSKATAEYSNKFFEQYGYKAFSIGDYQSLSLYLENGRYVSIITLKEGSYAITVKGQICYKKIWIKDVPIDHIELSCDYSQAIKKGVELLQKNDQLYIFKK